MARALQLAIHGLYTTGVNPRVGCVLVKDSQLIGEGWHERAGEAHAEVMALRDAERRGHDVKGATAYVTLEPCAHHGKTPPCAEALINAGISRVVAAMADPNPLVAGKGFALLQAAGIAVAAPLMAAEAEALNVGFVKRMRLGLPWVRLKTAGSLDGRSALANGQSQWITGPEARADGHRFRARAQAIITGVGTVVADDPLLTVRDVAAPTGQTGQPLPRTAPLRVVVDTHLRTPTSASILQGGCLIATASVDPIKTAALQAAGAEIVVLLSADGRVDMDALLRHLAQRGTNEVHVEAGAQLSGSFIKADLVDELLLYMAPTLLGSDARGWFDGLNLMTLDQKVLLQFQDVRMVGPDLRIIARAVK
ncbi:MAG: bifunctional diaminohydroxyphosphoribosylaminopyrimidine deaminase/5-amino-6-(5-phosphoribosylamino)uracil reductase RibD [Rhodocyclaceae bacterium]|nr:bifunctional diaminohydroxyphosphoribosylaminopyrimidine deaminase/5-amino-6-(5-phosphoribosylamino)uracil reductase RibD [Rhodocyclaceae bacterium]